MDLELTRQWITRWEGSRDRTYRDPRGFPTIGVGLNLATSAAQTAIEALGLDFAAVLSGAIALTPQQIDELLNGSIDIALSAAHALVPDFDTLPVNQQLVITDLAFNMGQPVLAEFKHTLNYIRLQDWTSAAANLRQSRWFHEAGSSLHQRGGADVAVLGNTTDPQTILGNTLP